MHITFLAYGTRFNLLCKKKLATNNLGKKIKFYREFINVVAMCLKFTQILRQRLTLRPTCLQESVATQNERRIKDKPATVGRAYICNDSHLAHCQFISSLYLPSPVHKLTTVLLRYLATKSNTYLTYKAHNLITPFQNKNIILPFHQTLQIFECLKEYFLIF